MVCSFQQDTKNVDACLLPRPARDIQFGHGFLVFGLQLLPFHPPVDQFGFAGVDQKQRTLAQLEFLLPGQHQPLLITDRLLLNDPGQPLIDDIDLRALVRTRSLSGLQPGTVSTVVRIWLRKEQR